MELNGQSSMGTSAAPQERLQSGYEALLLSYAAGALDQAQNLIVSTHLSYSDRAKNFVHSCEAIGGALIERECVPEKMNAGSLESVMERLDTPHIQVNGKSQEATFNDIHFETPECLNQSLSACKSLSWKPLMPGFHAMDIDLACKESTARFLKADPGIKSPHHSHGGTEITLVMDGAFHDETGNYKVGDLIVTDDSFKHAPIACKLQGCTCMVVSTAPIKLTGLASLLNPFLKP